MPPQNDNPFAEFADAPLEGNPFAEFADAPLVENPFAEFADDPAVQDNGKGRLSSSAASFARGAVEGVGQAVSGLARMVQSVNPQAMIPPGLNSTAQNFATPTPQETHARLAEDPVYTAGQALTEGGRDAYQPNPKYQGEFFSDVLPNSAGQLLPTLAAGATGNPLIAAGQYGLSQGQTEAEQAIAAGDIEDADKVFLANAGIGAISEFALGIPVWAWRIARAARLSGATPEIARKLIASQLVKGAAREAGQEGLEQAGQNVVAQNTYDPNRKTSEGVLQSIAAGAILGGPVAAAAETIGQTDARLVQRDGERLARNLQQAPTPGTMPTAAPAAPSPVVEPPVAAPTEQVPTPGATLSPEREAQLRAEGILAPTDQPPATQPVTLAPELDRRLKAVEPQAATGGEAAPAPTPIPPGAANTTPNTAQPAANTIQADLQSLQDTIDSLRQRLVENQIQPPPSVEPATAQPAPEAPRQDIPRRAGETPAVGSKEPWRFDREAANAKAKELSNDDLVAAYKEATKIPANSWTSTYIRELESRGLWPISAAPAASPTRATITEAQTPRAAAAETAAAGNLGNVGSISPTPATEAATQPGAMPEGQGVGGPPASAALRDKNTGEVWSGKPLHGLLHADIPNMESRQLEAGFADAAGNFITTKQVEQQTGLASGEELFTMSPAKRKQWFAVQRQQVALDNSLSPEQKTRRLAEIDANETKSRGWKKPTPPTQLQKLEASGKSPGQVEKLKGKKKKKSNLSPSEELRAAGMVGFPLPEQQGGGWFGTKDWRAAFPKIKDEWNQIDLLRAVANNRGNKATLADLQDALRLGNEMLSARKGNGDLANLGWDIAQNPAADAATKQAAMKLRGDVEVALRSDEFGAVATPQKGTPDSGKEQVVPAADAQELAFAPPQLKGWVTLSKPVLDEFAQYGPVVNQPRIAEYPSVSVGNPNTAWLDITTRSPKPDEPFSVEWSRTKDGNVKVQLLNGSMSFSVFGPESLVQKVLSSELWDRISRGESRPGYMEMDAPNEAGEVASMSGYFSTEDKSNPQYGTSTSFLGPQKPAWMYSQGEWRTLKKAGIGAKMVAANREHAAAVREAVKQGLPVPFDVRFFYGIEAPAPSTPTQLPQGPGAGTRPNSPKQDAKVSRIRKAQYDKQREIGESPNDPGLSLYDSTARESDFAGVVESARTHGQGGYWDNATHDPSFAQTPEGKFALQLGQRARVKVFFFRGGKAVGVNHNSVVGIRSDQPLEQQLPVLWHELAHAHIGHENVQGLIDLVDPDSPQFKKYLEAYKDPGLASEELVADFIADLSQLSEPALSKAFFNAEQATSHAEQFISRLPVQSKIPQGPGAATRPQQTKEAPEFVEGTALKNAVAELERAGLGMADAPVTVQRNMVADWDRAGETLKANPDAGRDIVAGLAADPSKGLTPDESAVLLRHKQTLMNRLNDAAEATQRGDTGAQQRYQQISDELLALMDAVKERGTTWGREGRWRQAMSREDYSFAAMEQQARIAKGRSLTPDESAEIKRLSDRIAELERQAAEARAKSETDNAVKGVQEFIGRTRNKAARETPANTDRMGKAKARLKTAKDEGAAGENLGSIIQQLARAYVEQGVTERNALVDAVHKDVTEMGFELSRRETMDAISGYGAFSQLNKDEISVALRDLKGQLQQVAKLEDMSEGRAPKKTGVERRQPSDEERRLIKQVEEAKRRGGFIVTDPATQLRSALDAKKARLRNQIADLTFQIEAKKKITKTRTPTPEDAETEALRKQRDELQAQFDEVFMTDLTRYKEQLQRRIADYERKIAEGDFAPKVKPERKLDDEALRLLARAEQAKLDFWKKKAEWKLEQRDFARKVVDSSIETALSARNIKTAFDVSAPGRQGILIGLGNPGILFRNLGPMFKALSSEERAMAVEQEIRSRDNFRNGVYQRAKLYISPLNATTLSAMEEAAMGHWAQKIPGVRASNRAYVTFLNKMRADAFDKMHAAASAMHGGKLTVEQEKALANYANVATGRGELGKAAGAATTAAQVLFSPRLLVSRFQYLAGQPLWHGDATTRKIIAKEYAKTILAATTVLTLAALAGADIEDDRRSSDFLKAKFGNTRVDILGGLPQILVFLSRLQTGEKVTATGKELPLREGRLGTPKFGQDTSADIIWRFTRTKFAPTLGGAVDVLSGENVVGEKVTVPSAVADQFKPLVVGDVINSFKEYDVPTATALSLLTMFGIGTQTYDPASK